METNRIRFLTEFLKKLILKTMKQTDLSLELDRTKESSLCSNLLSQTIAYKEEIKQAFIW